MGQIWHDVCATRADAAGAVVEAGPGCIFIEPDYQANGQREVDEPPLAGVTVTLAVESCTGAVALKTETDADGTFAFSGLAPGTYCVLVDAAAAENETLIEGRWTAGPETGETVIQLAEGETRDDLDFGWDFADLPLLAEADCEEQASFVADVTIPDYTTIRPEEPFEKIWRVRNEGTCTWTPEYSLVSVSKLSFGAAETVAFPSTVAPGGTVDLKVMMEAPASGGTYLSAWQFADADGRQFGIGDPPTETIWVLIQVTYLYENGSPAAVSPPPPPAGGATCAALDAGIASQVIALINAERAKAGLASLQVSAALNAAANVHSADMASNNFISHTGSDGSLWYGRIANHGYAYSAATENIYVGNPQFGGTPAGAVTWWMNSQVHRDNILSKSVTQIGVGYAFCAASTYGGYFTAVFARP